MKNRIFQLAGFLSMPISETTMSSSGRLRRVTYEYGLGYMWNTFESKLSTLFTKDTGESTVGVVREERDQVQWVSATEELCTIMKGESSTLLILKRYNSWSRIDVTVECFSTICELARITPFFLHFVVGMGTKFASTDEDFMSCYSTCASENQCIPAEFSGAEDIQDGSLKAICYNIRYFERHGRDLEDPWSCRQSALHHSFTAGSQHSAWVVVQPPEAFNLTIGHTPHPMALHLRYLQAAIANWREYLDSFSQRFKLLNQQIAIPNPYHKLKISFSHEQHLHHLKGKLHRAQHILTNMQATLSIITTHEGSIAQEQSLLPAVHAEFQNQLNNISREIDNYIATTRKLLHISDDLKSMYSDILTFQGQELQRETSLKLEHLAQEDAAGNKDMAVLASLAFKDSRSMRIATVIAMFYLPVNLVFSFFSSTLVWYGTTVEVAQNNGSRIQLRSETWIASVIAILLAIGTVSWSRWWNSMEEKKSAKYAIQQPTRP
ncbi:hypothetical protein GGR51DRAFT_503555 [Nemania sp. FL0031]|nr:hypothetical protein GGR51DRAFT_503555 [Nemania sp. FL0031]